ncbi:putative tail fiber protein [Vibrio phage VPMCC14]|nr:putative tail fiber protein [Vibrio phage VPMCC14]
MATEPTNPIVVIADSDVNLPSTQQPNKSEPSSTLQTTGFDKDQIVTAENLNYIFNNFADWLTYLKLTDEELEPRVNTLEGRNLTAGNGLTGGGDLSLDRTFTLGTPTSLDGSTSNGVTTDSHTHELNMASKAEAQTGTDNTKLVTPLRVHEAVPYTFSPSTVVSAIESVTLPNGKILKEGTSPSILANNTYNVVFQNSFPNQCTNIQLTIGRASAVDGNLSVYYTGKSSTGFTIILDPTTGAESDSAIVDWAATGY